MKRIMLCLLIILACAATLLPSSPTSISNAMDQLNQVEGAADSYRMVQGQVNSAVSGINSSRQEFDSNRSFDVYYGDIDQLLSLLNQVVGITVSGVYCVDAQKDFTPTVTYTEGDAHVPSAIRVTLIVDDTVNALRILDRMNLPLYSIDLQEPGTVSVIFLTGGGLS